MNEAIRRIIMSSERLILRTVSRSLDDSTTLSERLNSVIFSRSLNDTYCSVGTKMLGSPKLSGFFSVEMFAISIGFGLFLTGIMTVLCLPFQSIIKLKMEY